MSEAEKKLLRIWLLMTLNFCINSFFMIKWTGFEWKKDKVPQKSRLNRNSSYMFYKARFGPVSQKSKSCKFHHLIVVYDIEKVLYWLKHWWKLIDFLHTKAYCYLQLQIFSIIGSRGSEKNRQIATMDGVCPLPEPVINGWMLIFVKNQG